MTRTKLAKLCSLKRIELLSLLHRTRLTKSGSNSSLKFVNCSVGQKRHLFCRHYYVMTQSIIRILIGSFNALVRIAMSGGLDLDCKFVSNSKAILLEDYSLFPQVIFKLFRRYHPRLAYVMNVITDYRSPGATKAARTISSSCQAISRN